MRYRIHIVTALLLAHVLTSNAVAAIQTRTSAFEYDATSGLLTKEIIEPDNANLCLVTTYVYDAYGNKTSATTAKLCRCQRRCADRDTHLQHYLRCPGPLPRHLHQRARPQRE